MMINFRYRLLEKLGEGGSGEVFLVEDTCRKNQLLAMKVLHNAEEHLIEADEVFKNEVSALVTLSHPNLVRIFDFGVVRHADPALCARKFFTMELLRGVDALTWIESICAAHQKDDALQILMLQALSVLSYVHREGLVHFDIKPQNLAIVLDEKTTAAPLLKLADFGFSKKKEEVLDVSVRGTLEYTAPECLKGEVCDHRLDLYSLGATFYHLLEGRPPFEERNPVELAKRILSEEPRFTVENSALRRILHNLLKKAPSHRCTTAEDAARELSTAIPNGAELFEIYFGLTRSSRFVGRNAELSTIRDALSSLHANEHSRSQSAIAITGPEGIGKTALLRESLKIARSTGLTVYEISPLHSDIPFDGIVEILLPLIADIRSISDEGREVYDRYYQQLGFEEEGESRLEKWGTKKEETVELMSRFLLSCSEIIPYVLAVDNAHHLDEASANILRRTVRDAVNGRLIVITTEAAEQEKVFPSTLAKEVHAGELPSDAIIEISQSVLGDNPVALDIGSTLYNLYGGSPGVLLEALNAVQGMLPPQAFSDHEIAKQFIAGLETRLPRTIDDFLLVRFKKLSRERQLLLTILACFQFPVKEAMLTGIVPFHPARLSDHLRVLQLDEFITNGDGRIAIRMKKLKDAIYERIRDEKNELHALIASALEKDEESSMGFEGLQELAFQYQSCGKQIRSCSYFEKAGDEGLKLYALPRSLVLYREAITLAKSAELPQREMAVGVKLCLALHRSGSYKEAMTYCSELENRPELSRSQKATLLKVMGLSASRLGENELAQQLLTTVLQLSTDPVEQLELRQELVGLEISAGHFAQAEKQSEEQLEKANELNINRLAAAIYTDLGIITFFQQRYDDATEHFAKAMQRYETLGERTQVINSINNIGNALSAKGDYAHAIERWESALKESLQYGTLLQQAQIYNNLGIAYYNLKQYAKAKEYYQQARAMHIRMESRMDFAHSSLNLGEVMFAEGEYEAALNSLREAVDLYAALDHTAGIIDGSLQCARVCHRLGDFDAMEEWLGRSRERISDENMQVFLPRYRFLTGENIMAKKDFRAAEHQFRQASENLAGTLSNELYWFSNLRVAECLRHMGDAVTGVKILHTTLEASYAKSIPLVLAETYYQLGAIAAATPALVPERPLQYFRQGIEAIAKEPVSEITWRLTFALASEYHQRGQIQRAKEFLVKTKYILEFFLSHFSSQDLREKYLLVDNKSKVLATIASITRS